MSFAQTSHDYRDFEANHFQTMCYSEYMPTYKVAVPGIQEYDSAFTIGTMCLFRRSALEAAGGWAEWCLTEDSEVAVRLRAIGGEGIYLRDTFGRGLIPESFADYRKQRFRWTAGPVQQLRHHWRLYLPTPLGRRSKMKGWTKLLELQHSLAELAVLGTPIGLLVGVVFAALVASGSLPRVVLPNAAWIAMAIATVGQLARTWHTYRLAGCRRVADIAGGSSHASP